MSIEHVSQRIFIPREDGSLAHGIELPNGKKIPMEKEFMDNLDPDNSMTREKYVDKAIDELREHLAGSRELGGIIKAKPAYDLALQASVNIQNSRLAFYAAHPELSGEKAYVAWMSSISDM